LISLAVKVGFPFSELPMITQTNGYLRRYAVIAKVTLVFCNHSVKSDFEQGLTSGRSKMSWRPVTFCRVVKNICRSPGILGDQ